MNVAVYRFMETSKAYLEGECRMDQDELRESRRQQWLETVIDPWAQKHGITRLQAISVLFCDNTDGVTNKDAYWVDGNDFAGATMAQANLKAWSPLGRQAERHVDAAELALINICNRANSGYRGN